MVDVDDVLLVLNAWDEADCDADGSGVVGVEDLLLIIGVFGQGC